MRLPILLNAKPLVSPTGMVGETIPLYARFFVARPLDLDVQRGVRSTTNPWPGKTLLVTEESISAVELRGGNFEPPGIFILVHFWGGRIHQHNNNPCIQKCGSVGNSNYFQYRCPRENVKRNFATNPAPGVVPRFKPVRE